MPTLDAARLRALLVRYVLHTDAPAPDQRAFEAFAAQHRRVVILGTTALLAGATLLLWPLDRLMFAASPAVVEVYRAWRPVTAGIEVACILAILAPGLGRRAYGLSLLFGGAALFASSWLFAPLGGLDAPFFFLGFTFIFMQVPMLVGIGWRAAGAVWLVALFLAGLLTRRPGDLDHPWFPFFVQTGLLVAFSTVVFGHMVYHLARRNFFQRRAIEEQAVKLAAANEKSERLLLNILPAPIAERLKEDSQAIADRFAEVTVLFADICGFTPLSESLPPEALVRLLNEIFSEFDALVARHGLEKIKTIGDAYMVAGGLPTPRDDHADAVAHLALDMAAVAARFKGPDGRPVRMRIGVHSGAVVAGVIGLRKFSYDLWGDTVNTASRMESHGVPGAVAVSEETRRRLGERFTFEDRGLLPVKGKGEMRLFLLTGRVEAAAPAA